MNSFSHTSDHIIHRQQYTNSTSHPIHDVERRKFTLTSKCRVSN